VLEGISSVERRIAEDLSRAVKAKGGTAGGDGCARESDVE